MNYSPLEQIKAVGNVEALTKGTANGILDLVELRKSLPSEVKSKFICKEDLLEFSRRFVEDPFILNHDADILRFFPRLKDKFDLCSYYIMVSIYAYRLSVSENRETKEFIRKDFLKKIEEFANLLKTQTGLPRTFIYGVLYANIQEYLK